MQQTRIASVSYLNALPLTRGLTHGSLAGRHQVTLCPPAECSRLLSEGLADVALLPSVEFARLPGLSAIWGCGVAARREVRSVLLLTRVPLDQVRTLAVDLNSRTSVALARVLLKRRYGARPRLEPMPPDPRAMLARHDAALMIGDAALRTSEVGGAPDPAVRIVDLASEWNEMTGMPFVFAFWACRPVVSLESIRGDLARSLEEGLASIQSIACEEAARTGIPAPAIADYLAQSIQHRLGASESESLRLFYRYCREDGLLAGPEAGVSSSSETVKSG